MIPRPPFARQIIFHHQVALYPIDRSEGSGLTLLEANATGRPVIASDVAGIPSIVKHDVDSLLVPPRDEKALAETIINLMKDEDRPREMRGLQRLCSRLFRSIFCLALMRVRESMYRPDSTSISSMPSHSVASILFSDRSLKSKKSVPVLVVTP